MALDCTRFPTPNAARMQQSEKKTAVPWRPASSRQYIVPPTKPSPSLRRRATAMYTSAYLMAAVTSPHTHIQNTLPAPPSEMPSPTPTMLPMPTVPPSAVESAVRGDMPPFSVLRLPEKVSRSSVLKPASWMHLLLTVKYRPKPKISPTVGSPQIRSRSSLNSKKRPPFQIVWVCQ